MTRKKTLHDADCPGTGQGSLISAPIADLHVHSTASDGVSPPEDLVALASERGLSAIAIADHDTTRGVRSLLNGASGIRNQLDSITKNGVEVVPAIEINSDWQGRELHVLGYFVPLEDGPFQDLLKELRDVRKRRIDDMIERLCQLGMPVPKDRVWELAKGESIGRPHIAAVMVENGYVSTIGEAFDRFIGRGKIGYVEREHLSPEESVRAIRESGGVAVWAHPGTTRADHLLPDLVARGLKGLEAYHPEHGREDCERYLNLAAKHNLCVTGGSDYHGSSKSEGEDLGNVHVPYETIARLRSLSTLA